MTRDCARKEESFVCCVHTAIATELLDRGMHRKRQYVLLVSCLRGMGQAAMIFMLIITPLRAARNKRTRVRTAGFHLARSTTLRITPMSTKNHFAQCVFPLDLAESFVCSQAVELKGSSACDTCLEAFMVAGWEAPVATRVYRSSQPFFYSSHDSHLVERSVRGGSLLP